MNKLEEKCSSLGSSVIEAATLIREIAMECPHIYRITSSVIITHGSSRSSWRRVRIVPESELKLSLLVVSIATSTADQTMYLHATDREAALKFLKIEAEKRKLLIA